jgi:hypothetical protein
MPIVHAQPSEFVAFLTNPGINAAAGRIPLKQYVCLSKANGGNDEINALLGGLRAKAIRDASSGQTIDEFVGATELNLLWKGQGHWRAFVDVMDFLTENKGQLKGVPGILGKVYETYFAKDDDATALKRMVKDRYFGIDCIGFVANYLRYARLWREYLPYEIDQWDRVFTQKVNTIDDVEHLNVMVWPGSHVALVDVAWADNLGPKKCKIDMCQSSSGGPQVNKGVYLTDSGTFTGKGYKLFALEGDVPVGGHCYLMKWPELRCIHEE